MKTINQTEYICSDCHTKFKAATLSDFSYGEFLLWSSSNNCLYLNALEDETYKEVINLIDTNKLMGNIQVSDTSLLLQNIYGELACDSDEAGRAYHIGYPPCPNCGNTNMDSVSEVITGSVAINTVTHKVWNALTQQKKETQLLKMA